MNLKYLRKCAERQHKATLAIAQNLVGLPAVKIPTLPFLAKNGTVLFFCAPFHAVMDMDFVNPYIMNASFALELRLKYLHALETGQAMPDSHRLKVIFDSLTQLSRERIKAHFSDFVRDNAVCKLISNQFNEGAKIQFKWDVEMFLDKSSLAFERWRYIYEEKSDPTWFVGYSEITHAINRRIEELQHSVDAA